MFHYIISMIAYPNFYAGIFASGCLKKIQKFVLKNIIYPTGIFLFKVNYGNTRAMCEICLKLTTKKSKWRQWGRSGVFLINFEQIVVSLLFCFFHCWLWASKCQLDCFGYRQFWFWKLWKQHNLLKRVKRWLCINIQANVYLLLIFLFFLHTALYASVKRSNYGSSTHPQLLLRNSIQANEFKTSVNTYPFNLIFFLCWSLRWI